MAELEYSLIKSNLTIDHGYDDEKHLPTAHHTHCFGCCCDFRKAIMILDGFVLVVQTIALIFITFCSFVLSSAAANINTDGFEEGNTEIIGGKGNLIGIVGFSFGFMVFIGMLNPAMGFYGAYKFNNCALICNTIFLSIPFLINFGNMINYFNGGSIFAGSIS